MIATTRLYVRPRVGGVPADLGAPALPGSKSHAQRALILAGLGTGRTVIAGAPDGDDVRITAAAVAALGARVRTVAGELHVDATPALRDARVDCRDNGTALRMLTMAVGVLGARAWFDGSARLQQRPLREVRDALRGLGAGVSPEWPLDVDARACGRFTSTYVAVAANDTSQAASGALLGAGCRLLRGDCTRAVVALEPPATAAVTYLRVTVRVLQAFGVRSEASARADGGATYRLQLDAAPPPGGAAPRIAIGADASAFTFVAALARLHRLRPPPRPEDDGHPDWTALDELEALARSNPGTTWRSRNLALAPDSFPALCALAAARPGRSELLGAPALRHKESDRVAAMAAGLRALGATCEARDDGLVVHGRDLTSRHGDVPVAVPTVPDHRVVMALALLGTILPAGVAIEHADAVAKSWPDYFAWLGRVAQVEPAAG